MKNRKKRTRKLRCTSREKKVLKFLRKVYFGPVCMSWLVKCPKQKNMRALAQKSRIIDIFNTGDVLQRKFREWRRMSVCPMCSGASSRTYWSPVNPAILFQDIKVGYKCFITLYKYHCLQEYYTSQKFRECCLLSFLLLLFFNKQTHGREEGFREMWIERHKISYVNHWHTPIGMSRSTTKSNSRLASKGDQELKS